MSTASSATRTARHRAPHAFTLVELLVVIGIIAVLISILMPALRRARNQAQKVDCESRIHQIMLATQMYTQVFKGWLPGPQGGTDPPGPQSISVETGWLWTAGFLKNHDVWICPIDPRPPEDRQYSYTYNGRMITVPGHELDDWPTEGNGLLFQNPPNGPQLRRVTSFKYPSECLVYSEENITGMSVGQYLINDCYFIFYDVSDDRHMGKAVAGYLDGHGGEIPAKLQLFISKQWGYCR